MFLVFFSTYLDSALKTDNFFSWRNGLLKNLERSLHNLSIRFMVKFIKTVMYIG